MGQAGGQASAPSGRTQIVTPQAPGPEHPAVDQINLNGAHPRHPRRLHPRDDSWRSEQAVKHTDLWFITALLSAKIAER